MAQVIFSFFSFFPLYLVFICAAPSFPSLLPCFPHPVLREGQASSGKSVKFVPSTRWGRTKVVLCSCCRPLSSWCPPPTPRHLRWARYLSVENGLHKVITCIRVNPGPTASDSSYCPSHTHHCHLYSGGLVRSYASAPVVSLESVSSH